MSQCLVCNQKFRDSSDSQRNFHVHKNLTKVLESLFNVFCNYLDCNEFDIGVEGKGNEEWKWDLKTELIPFCEVCKNTVAQLSSLHLKLESIQREINKIIAKVLWTIIQSGDEEETLDADKENSFNPSTRKKISCMRRKIRESKENPYIC